MGVLPIFATLASNDPDQQTPLDVSLNQVSLNLKGLYQGGVGGDVQITGTAFNPIVGGTIQLSNGQVLLSSAEGGGTNSTGEAAATGTTASSGGGSGSTTAFGGSTNVIAFNNLGIALKNNVSGRQSPAAELRCHW